MRRKLSNGKDVLPIHNTSLRTPPCNRHLIFTGNGFVIGGKPNTKVYWQVTGKRKDIHAEIARIQTPVEQQKTGELIGHPLDDDALIGIYYLLQQEKPGCFNFRTEDGEQVHEQSKRIVESRE